MLKKRESIPCCGFESSFIGSVCARGLVDTGGFCFGAVNCR